MNWELRVGVKTVNILLFDKPSSMEGLFFCCGRSDWGRSRPNLRAHATEVVGMACVWRKEAIWAT
jgi:hypothetical protein